MLDIADAAADRLAERGAEHTPHDTHRTAERWRALPAERVPDGWRAKAENPSPLAHLLEYGTKPHRLAPDEAEAIETLEGPRAHADHPGSRPFGMLAKAAADIEA